MKASKPLNTLRASTDLEASPKATCLLRNLSLSKAAYLEGIRNFLMRCFCSVR